MEKCVAPNCPNMTETLVCEEHKGMMIIDSKTD